MCSTAALTTTSSPAGLAAIQHLAGSRTGANCDLIIGFTRGNNVTGDAIDLRTIGAKTVVAGNQAFHFSREGRNQRPCPG
jgi:hypothetical protein